jgi:preprotein translocase subunit SecB
MIFVKFNSTFISNMVLQAGMAPIIIPPVNFTKVIVKETAFESENPNQQL